MKGTKRLQNKIDFCIMVNKNALRGKTELCEKFFQLLAHLVLSPRAVFCPENKKAERYTEM